MFNLRQAQIITRKIQNEYFTREQIKWESIYNNTNEIIEDLKKIYIPSIKEEGYIFNLYSGYEYIHSFAKQIQAGKELTEKQIVQCKRLALEIKKASSISECWSK